MLRQGEPLIINRLVGLALSANLIQVCFAGAEPSCGRLLAHDPRGPALEVALEDDLVVFSEGMLLTVADVSNSANPKVLGRVELPEVPLDMALAQRHAWLACGSGGLVGVDLSHPASPSIVSSTDLGSEVRAVTASEDLIAVGTGGVSWGWFRVELLRATDPASPTRIWGTELPIYHTSYHAGGQNLALTPSHVMVAASHPAEHERRLFTISISDPAVTSWIPQACDTVMVSGPTLYCAGYSYQASDRFLSVFDVSGAAPMLQGQLVLPRGYGPTDDLEVDAPGQWLWIGHGRWYNRAFSLVDVRDRTNPQYVNTYQITTQQAAEIGVSDLSIDDGRLAIAASSGGLQLYDVRNPTSPGLRSTIRVTGTSQKIAVDDQVALVATSYSAPVRVVDLDDPTEPRVVAELAYRVNGLDLRGGYAYLAGYRPDTLDSGIAVIDLTDPENPREEAWVDQHAWGVEIEGAVAYVLDDDLLVYDISDPTDPVLVSSVDAEVRELTLGEGWAVGSAPMEALTYDMADPRHPTLISRHYHEGSHPTIIGNHAYSVSGKDLRIYSRQLNWAGKEQLLDHGGGGVMSMGTLLLAGDRFRGIRVLNALNPTKPLRSDLVDIPDLAGEIAPIGDGLVLAALGDAGFAVVDVSQCDPLASTLLLDAAASGEGINQSVWSTDMEITNGGEDTAVVHLRFLPQDENNADRQFDAWRRIEPLATWRLADVWGANVGDGSGSVQILTDAPDRVAVNSRTFNTGADGTFGQGIPALSSSDLYRHGETARVIRMSQTARIRGNLGMVNAADAPIRLVVDFFAANGDLLGTDAVSLPPLGSTQWNRAFRRVTTDPVEVGYVDVRSTTPGSAFSVYGSVVDNLTGDPTTLLPLRPGAVFVAAAAAAEGAGGSLWSTELEVNNSGDRTVSYQMHLVPRGSAGTSGHFTEAFTLDPGHSVRYNDAWGELMGEGAGSIEVVSDDLDLLRVTSRTFNTGSTGTYGQGIPGISDDDLFSTGEVALLGQLAQTPRFRSNIVFANRSGHSVDLVVEFHTRDGTSLGIARLDGLAPGGTAQWNEAFKRVTAANINGGYARVRCETPDSSFYAIGSVVDNDTGDPTTILPR